MPLFPPALTITSYASTVPPYVLSDWERTTYYKGISRHPPELLYRSDLLENPFPIPKGRHPHVLTKTACGVHNTPLNAVWDTVAPQICEFLEASNIRYSAVKAARFLTRSEDKDTLGPVVIWIATHPTTTTAKSAHDASPGILALLKDNGVEGVVVEWYEGAIEKLSGPPLLGVTDPTDPTRYVRRFLTATLGMPIAPAEMEGVDLEGSVTLFFHENKDKHGNASAKVFGVSNCHVLRGDTQATIDYEFEDDGAPPQNIRLAGFRRFRRGISDIKACIREHRLHADLLAREIVKWEAKPKNEDPQEATKDEAVVEAKRKQLAKVRKDIDVLMDFCKDVSSQWCDITCRNIGHVDWAPEISVDVQGHRYTKDIGTFELDAAKFMAQFKGNVVDLGSRFTNRTLANMFYPGSDSRPFEFPEDRQLRITGCVAREFLGTPDYFEENGNPCLLVMKDGNTTDLTVGRRAGLEAYLSNELGVKSIELAFYNYDEDSGPFSTKGDSGSLIFNAEGLMVGILHSCGVKQGTNTHVTYATPAWWAIEQIKLRYPHADFYRTAF